jgi:hypothetical protein
MGPIELIPGVFTASALFPVPARIEAASQDRTSGVKDRDAVTDQNVVEPGEASQALLH